MEGGEGGGVVVQQCVFVCACVCVRVCACVYVCVAGGALTFCITTQTQFATKKTKQPNIMFK